MVCAKCGALVDDNITVCDNCGYVFEDNIIKAETDGSEYNISPNSPAIPDTFEQDKKPLNKKTIALCLWFVLCAAIVVLFFYGAHYVSRGAIAINSIQSSVFGFSDGASNDYYRFMGVAIYGISYCLRGLGIGLGAISFALGVKLIKK